MVSYPNIFVNIFLLFIYIFIYIYNNSVIFLHFQPNYSYFFSFSKTSYIMINQNPAFVLPYGGNYDKMDTKKEDGMLHKNDIPILEYSDAESAVINPQNTLNLPAKCLMTFFEEVLLEKAASSGARKVGAYHSEMRDFDIYVFSENGEEFCMTLASVGGASAAMQADFLFGNGVEVLYVCGSCGVLADIGAGEVIIPEKALRGEGASYMYLPPKRFIELDRNAVGIAEETVSAHGVRAHRTVTWTTDGFYRECAEMVEYRKSEGCEVVEMECASLAAVAQFRGKLFGQLLYSGDILCDTDNYDDRDWYNNKSARTLLFELALEILKKL